MHEIKGFKWKLHDKNIYKLEYPQKTNFFNIKKLTLSNRFSENGKRTNQCLKTRNPNGA